MSSIYLQLRLYQLAYVIFHNKSNAETRRRRKNKNSVHTFSRSRFAQIMNFFIFSSSSFYKVNIWYMLVPIRVETNKKIFQPRPSLLKRNITKKTFLLLFINFLTGSLRILKFEANFHTLVSEAVLQRTLSTPSPTHITHTHTHPHTHTHIQTYTHIYWTPSCYELLTFVEEMNPKKWP